eukprot:366269-Chlamydomonas_euryale.AAC.6
MSKISRCCMRAHGPTDDERDTKLLHACTRPNRRAAMPGLSETNDVKTWSHRWQARLQSCTATTS